MSENKKSHHRESHIEWLNRQRKHEKGYPKFMSQQAIKWLEDKVTDYCMASYFKDGEPKMADIVKHWSRQVDLPYDLSFMFKDGLYAVTHRAMLSMEKRCEIGPFTIRGNMPQQFRRHRLPNQ
jgi:hypothetical protein